MTPITIAELARCPVKSMSGESPASLVFDARGAVGDRLWAVRDADGKLGSGKNTRRFRRIDGLLGCTARYEAPRDGDTGSDGGTPWDDEPGVPVIVTPDGDTLRASDPDVHDRLSALLGRAVTLVRETDVPHQDAGAVSLTTTGSLRALGALLGDDGPADARRFRMNLVVDTGDEPWTEETWTGRELAFGDLRLRVVRRIERCVMTNLPQPGLPADPRVLRTLSDHRSLCFGVYADVLRPGSVSLGDPVDVGPSPG